MPFLKQAMLTALVALSLLYGAVPGQAGTLRGRVCDDGRQPPADGIGSVRITVTAKTGNTLKAVTDADGGFVVTDVPNVDVVIELHHDDYARQPTEVPWKVAEGDNRIPLVHMWRPEVTDARYFQVVAENLLGRAKKNDNFARAIHIEWLQLTRARVPLAFKHELAVALHEQDEQATKSLPVLREYMSLDREKAAQLQLAFMQAAKTDGVVGKMNEVVAKNAIPSRLYFDAILSTYYAKELSPEQRTALLNSAGDAKLDARERDIIKAWKAPPTPKSLRKDGLFHGSNLEKLFDGAGSR